MAKQKPNEHLNLDLSDLFSEAEKAIATISKPQSSTDDEISIEIEIEGAPALVPSDDSYYQEPDEDYLDLDAELAALEERNIPRSEMDLLKEELSKAKKIIRLQKSKLKQRATTQIATPKNEAQLQSLEGEIVHLKERVKEGHRAQLERSKMVQEIKEQLKEEQERSIQLRSSYTSMRSKAEDLKQTAAQLQTRLRRVQERRKKDGEDHKKFGSTPAVKAIIPTIENLERALKFPDVDKASLIKGILLSLDQLSLDLAKIGLDRVVSTRGTEFDPSVHEAVQRMVDATIQEGGIVQEIAAGFSLNGRLIRAAKVAVATSADVATQNDESKNIDDVEITAKNTRETVENTQSEAQEDLENNEGKPPTSSHEEVPQDESSN